MSKRLRIEDLPPDWQAEVKNLRAECAKHRTNLRAAQARITELENGLDD